MIQRDLREGQRYLARINDKMRVVTFIDFGLDRRAKNTARRPTYRVRLEDGPDAGQEVLILAAICFKRPV